MSGSIATGRGGAGGAFDDDGDDDDHRKQVLPSRVRHFVTRVLTCSNNNNVVISGLMSAAVTAFPPPIAGAGAGSASSQFALVPQRHLSISGLQSTPLQYLPPQATPSTTHLGPSSSPATTPMMAPAAGGAIPVTRPTQLSPRVGVYMSPRGGKTTTTTTTRGDDNKPRAPCGGHAIEGNSEQLATLYSQTDRVHHKELKRDKEVRHIKKQARRLSMSLSVSLQQQRRSTIHQGSIMGSGSGGLDGVAVPPPPSSVVGGDVFLMGHTSVNINNNTNTQQVLSTSSSHNPLHQDAMPHSSINTSDIQAFQQQVDAVVFKSAQERRQLKLRQRRLRKLAGGASSSSSEVSVTVGNDADDGGDNIDEFLDDNLLLYGSDVSPTHPTDGGSPGSFSVVGSSRNSPFGRSVETGGGTANILDAAALPPLLYSDGTAPTTDITATPQNIHMAPAADGHSNNPFDRNSPVRVVVDRASSLWDAYYSPSPQRQSK